MQLELDIFSCEAELPVILLLRAVSLKLEEVVDGALEAAYLIRILSL